MTHILVLLTPEAQDALLEATNNNTFIAELHLWLSMYTIDVAYLLSDIPNKNVRFTVVPFEMELSNKIDEDLENLQVTPLLVEYNADVAIMLTDHRYIEEILPGLTVTYLGLANCVGFAEDGTGPCNKAIVVVESMNAPHFVFAHEFAHLVGARHNRTTNGGDDDTNICGHALKFTDESGQENRTIMTTASSLDDMSRILNFSNPDVSFNGAPTGTVLNDNAKTIRFNACEMTSGDEMMAGIDGAGLVCDPNLETYTANVVPASNGTPGQPPFTYHWRWNTTGVFLQNNGTYAGTYLGNSSSVTVGNLNCPRFYLFLQVNSSDGVIATRVRKIETNDCAECIVYGGGLMAPPSGNINSTGYVTIEPNPATDKAALSFDTEAESSFSFFLSDMQGRMVFQSVERLAEPGKNRVDLPVNDLPSGMYFCNVEINGQRTTLKLMVSKP